MIIGFLSLPGAITLIMRSLARNTAQKEHLSSIIEYTYLSPKLSETELLTHFDEAKSLKVFGICIPLAWVPLAKKELEETNIKVVTVVDFPLGIKSPSEKALETKAAFIFGADEIDMVVNYQAIIDKKYDLALAGISAVLKEAKEKIVKVIIETSALSKEQIAIACALVALAHAPFIKTSTGFHKGGANIADIKLIRSLLPEGISIKASGGIRNFDTALAMWQAGAVRIGTSKAKEILEKK